MNGRMAKYLARIKLAPKTPGSHGLLYWRDGGIVMHNIDHGWDLSEHVRCREEDARDVITLCWYEPVWELEMLMEGAAHE